MRKTKLLTSLAAFVLVLGLGACTEAEEETTSDESGEVTTTDTDTEETSGGETPSESTPEGGNEGEEDETIPGTSYVIGESYWFGYEYSNKLYSFTGALYSSNYGGVTTDTNGAASVTLGKAEGGYTLSVDDAGTTKYVAFSENNTYRNFALVEEAFVWEYNATYDTFVALDSTNDYVFIGNYYGQDATYNELRVSSIGYLDGTKSSSNTQYPAHLYAQETPKTLTISGLASLEVGETATLNITTEDRACHDVIWASSDENVATITSYGEVEALAEGETKIIATSIKDSTVVSEEFAITVTEPVSYSSSESLTASSLGYSDAADLTTVSMTNTTLTFGKGSNSSNSPKYYVSDSSFRVYKQNTLAFAANSGYTIGRIELQCVSTSYVGADLEVTAGDVSTSGDNVIILSAEGFTACTLTNGNSASTNTQLRITSLTIYYL